MPTSLPAPLKRLSLVDSVYEELREWIIDGIRDEGVRVNIDALARSFDVSPTPVREALIRLEAEGFVVKEPSRGYSVTSPLSADEVDDLFELRLLIEPWAARRAAETADPTTTTELAADIDRFDGAPDGRSFAAYRDLADHDARFHTTVLDLAGNPEVTQAFTRTNCHLHLFRLSYGRDMGNEALTEHRAVLHALGAGDGAGAEAAMRRHLERSLDRFRRVFA